MNEFGTTTAKSSFSSTANDERINHDHIHHNPRPSTRRIPTLIETAEHAYELTKVDWSDLGSACSGTDPDTAKATEATEATAHESHDASFGFDRIETHTENILALMLIRIVAILHERSDTPRLPLFRDLSTTTICRTIMADEARRKSDEDLQKEMEPLEWPKLVSEEVVLQLQSYIFKTLSMYRGVFYHNCEHAHHVFLSANKLLDLMLCEYNWTSLDTSKGESHQQQQQQQQQQQRKAHTSTTERPRSNESQRTDSTCSVTTAEGVKEKSDKEKRPDPNPFFDVDYTLKEEGEEEEKNDEMGKSRVDSKKNDRDDKKCNDHNLGIQELTFSLEDLTMMEPSPKRKRRPTYGIKGDPLIHLGFLFSALVHDVDHKGITNRQLVLESDDLAIMYNDQSVAEQRSLAVAFTLLMEDKYVDLRCILFVGRHEFLRFRSNVIGLVLCTDISSPERVQIGKSKWKEAFGERKKEKHGHNHNHNNSNSNSRRDSNDTNGTTDHEDAEMKKNELARRSKERNAWKSKPADPTLAEPTNKNNLVRQFFSARGSMTRSKSMHHAPMNDDDENSTSLYGSFSDNDDFSVSSDRSDSSAYSTCMESEGELSIYSLKKWNSAQRQRPGSADPNNRAVANRRRRSQEHSQQIKSGGGRRFSEPHYILSRRRKFHFRLGIRRALDLTGTTIEAYDKKGEKHGRFSDPDRPNCLKAIVVLEQMLRAADIAANMQVRWISFFHLQLFNFFVHLIFVLLPVLPRNGRQC